MKRVAELAQHLKLSGYSNKLIFPPLNKVYRTSRLSLIDNPTKEPTISDSPPPVTFITTFCPQGPDVRATHAANAHILDASTKMKNLLPRPPRIAYRRTKKLGDLLFNTRPPKPLNTGTHPCKDKRCKLNQYIIQGNQITSSNTGNTHTVKDHITCNTQQVIYIITCTLCNKQYTGQTSLSLRLRMNNHISSIRRKDTKQPVANHFNLPGHTMEHFRVQGAAVVNDKTDLNRLESMWMWRVRSHESCGGLNIDEPYIHPLSIET